MIRQSNLEQFSAQAAEHLFGHILPFWCGPALDNKNGGWMAWLSNDLKPDRSKPKGLIVNARILWTFSAVYRVKPDPLCQEMAQRAFDVVMNKFWDTKHGGAFWQLNDQFKVIDDSKKIYGQAFYMYALTEFHHAFGSEVALERAAWLFELIDRHARDAQFGGYFEVRRRDWSEAAADARLSDKDMNEKKSMNNHLHVLEACTNLYRARREPRVAGRLRELIEIFLTRILDARTKHLNHFFDEQWNVRSDTYTFGHDIEASWLLCEAAEELGDKNLFQRVRELAVQMTDAVFNEGLSADGALCYEGKDGKIIDTGSESWPQAEALIGFLNAFEISRDGKFLAAALRVWSYINQKIVDRAHGEWFWRINPDGKPDATLPKVSEWKGPYHASRACLEILRRVKAFVHEP
ncbi:MAG TPA: AGE family epimerase/isomerase [Candidatus Polarisedimenticolia bacterium]|nr:AGE family epimerase/isomerase [Candidatus Polarisedimenticolia bacterium]